VWCLHPISHDETRRIEILKRTMINMIVRGEKALLKTKCMINLINTIQKI